jgi:hypothetical protein
MKSINITETLQSAIDTESFIFNPSITLLAGNVYLISFRSVVNNPGKPVDKTDHHFLTNKQHPWYAKWKAGHDTTYIVPVTITDKVRVIKHNEWPLNIPGQDARVYTFSRSNTEVGVLVTFNRAFDRRPDMLIKGGDTCKEYCYIIDWGYLVVDILTLNYKYLSGDAPLCLNISNPVEKNWSLWQYRKDRLVHVMLSYALTPQHSAYTFKLTGVSGDNIFSTSNCIMNTERPKASSTTFLRNLELHYPGLHVSLSTPAYQIDETTFQAVGHIKCKRESLTVLPNSKLAKFAKKPTKYLHPIFIYFIFIYRFKIAPAKPFIPLVEQASVISLGPAESDKITAKITHVF